MEGGDLWLSNIKGSKPFAAPKIDADLIQKQLENKYIKEGLDKQQRILFQDAIQIKVMDLQKDKEDTDLTAIFEDMANAPEVSLDDTYQRRWRDVVSWGPSPMNKVWGYEGREFRLQKLNVLHPYSFSNSGYTYSYRSVRNRILPGILWNPETNEIEFWQYQSDGVIRQLQNIDLLVDPMATEPGGTSSIIPLVPIITMLNFAWTKKMQEVNIYGSGGLWFIKVSNPRGDDKEWAQKILRNESSTNRYQLRENMEVINLGMTATGATMDTITELGMQIRRFFSPSDILSATGDSQIIGGSSGPEYQLYMSYIKGTHRYLERSIQNLFAPYLIYNAYDPKRYRIIVDIPEPTIDQSELKIKQGELLAKYGALTKDQLREKVGDAPLPNGEGSALIEAGTGSTLPPLQFQKAQLGIDYMKADPFARDDDPAKVKAKRLIQTTLGIESGEA